MSESGRAKLLQDFRCQCSDHGIYGIECRAVKD